jgi:hypothetical protein
MADVFLLIAPCAAFDSVISPFEWFEKEPNPWNCSIRLIENNVDKGYIFQGF